MLKTMRKKAVLVSAPVAELKQIVAMYLRCLLLHRHLPRNNLLKHRRAAPCLRFQGSR